MKANCNSIRTIVRIIDTSIIRLPGLRMFPADNSTGCSYEISVELEALDCRGNVELLDTYDVVYDLIQAWEIVKDLRPGTLHIMEVDLTNLCGGEKVYGPTFSAFTGDVNLADQLFSPTGSDSRPVTEQDKSISGRLKSVLIDTTSDRREIAVVELVERSDYWVVVFPHLYEEYRGKILNGAYLEYRGPVQACHVANDCPLMVIAHFVKALEDVGTDSEAFEELNMEQRITRDVILFLHGKESSPATSSSAADIREYFENYEVLVPDYRPLERSHGEIEEYLSSYIEDVLNRSDGEVNLVGISLGGYWAYRMASHLQYVTRVVLLNPSFRCYPGVPPSAPKQNLPVSLIVCLDDEVVDPHDAIARLQERARIVTFESGGHRFANRGQMLQEVALALQMI